MILSPNDIQALWLSVKLAAVVTLVLLIIGTPVAWWLANTRSRWRGVVMVMTALPLVLPPTVLGFYFLLLSGPSGPIGQATQAMGLGVLPFSFAGLVVASVVYSLPFVVQPLYSAMSALGRSPIDVAATLGAGPVDRFFSVVLPLCRHGFYTAAVLGFAHTVGEFGIVLMMGGGIPGVTQVASVAIYEHVEALDYASAHRLAGVLLVFACAVLFSVYSLQARQRRWSTMS